MALIRKQQAGSDSYGHTWDADGAVVEIDDGEQIASLMAIPDGGFSEVTPDADEDPDAPEAPEDPEEKELSEIDPDAPAGEPDTRAPAKKAAARKTTARKSVEEG